MKENYKITVIGIGDEGISAIKGLAEHPDVHGHLIGLPGYESVRLNLEGESSEGEYETDSTAAGSNRESSEAFMDRIYKYIGETFDKTDIIILIALLGGKTGLIVAPLLGLMARKYKIPCVGLFTLPSQFELDRTEKAQKALKWLNKILSCYLTFPGDKLRGLEKSDDSALIQKYAEIINLFEQRIAEHRILGKFEKKTQNLSNSKIAAYGFGHGKGKNALQDAVANAMKDAVYRFPAGEQPQKLFFLFQIGKDVEFDKWKSILDVYIKSSSVLVAALDLEQNDQARVSVLASSFETMQ